MAAPAHTAASVHEALLAALQELKLIDQSLDKFEQTGEREKLAEVSSRMKAIGPKLKELCALPECKTKENAPLLIELSNGMKQSVNRTKSLASTVTALGSTPTGASALDARPLSTSFSKSDNSGSFSSSQYQSIPPATIHHQQQPNTSSSSSSSSSSTAPLQGYLKKQGEKGPIKSFKRRWFIQKDTKLFYYSSENDLQPLGYIDLTQMMSVVPNTKIPFGFDLVTPKREYHLQATGELELRYWQDGLRVWKNQYDAPAPPHTATPAAPVPVATPSTAGGSAILPQPIAAAGTDQASSSVPSTSSTSASTVPSTAGSTSVLPSPVKPVAPSSTAREAVDVLPSTSSTAIPSLPSTTTATAAAPVAPLVVPLPQKESVTVAIVLPPPSSSTASPPPPASSSAGPVSPTPSSQQLVQNQNNSSNVNDQRAEELTRQLNDERAAAAQLRLRLNAAEQQLRQRDEEIGKLKEQVSAFAALPADKALAASTLREMEISLRTIEDQNMELKKQLLAKNEEIRTRDAKIQSLQDVNMRHTEELSGKDQQIGKMHDQIQKFRLISNSSTQSDLEERLKAELTKLRASVTAHHSHNCFLEAEITRLEREHKAALDARHATIEALQKDFNNARHEFTMFRRKGADEKSLDEMEDLKKELFAALVIGIKLQMAMQGQQVTTDSTSLYEEAKEIPHQQWNDWIFKRLLAKKRVTIREPPSPSSSPSSSKIIFNK